MTRPWRTVEAAPTEEGPLELKQRGEKDFLITVGGRVLMNSVANRSELALGTLGCRGLAAKSGPRVLVGGLGMGFTLRAVLDALPPTAEVVVAELNPVVVRWCQGPLGPLTGHAVADPRVRVEVGDVARLIRAAGTEATTRRFDAIVIDLYVGPDAGTRREDPLYGAKAVARTREALVAGGTFAIWGEALDAGFIKRLESAGFSVRCERPGRGGLKHVVYVATASGRR